MNFTDGMLNELKAGKDWELLSDEEFAALLARLEAAEVLSQEIANIHGHGGPGNWNDVIECRLCPAIRTWRKTAGQ